MPVFARCEMMGTCLGKACLQSWETSVGIKTISTEGKKMQFAK